MTTAAPPPVGMSDWTMSEIHETFDTHMGDELLKVLIGPRIGRGVSREVFEMSWSPQYVVKLEVMHKGWFANIAEYKTWNEVKGTPYEPWFAPVHSLSLGGTMLVQSRTNPPAMRDLPESVPAIFSDVKISNFGMLDGRLVCHDYALLINPYFVKKIKMVKAFWA